MGHPKTTITVEQARANRDRFLASSNIDYSAFTFEYTQLKEFLENIESEKLRGIDVKYLTVYLSEYEDGEKSAFLAPLKENGTPNYDLRVLNHANVRPPMGKNERGTTNLRY